MSQFDRYTKTEYVEALRAFMGYPKRTFLRDHGFIPKVRLPRSGRLPRYEDAPVRALEEKVNARAAAIESATTFEERYLGARAYKGVSDLAVAQAVGMSRELVRRWSVGVHRCTRIAEVAEFLDVPADWLEFGGQEKLPADSHIGVRVGEASRDWRERLFGAAQSIVAELPEGSTEDYARAFIEWKIFNDPELARISRWAGGRWQLVDGMLLFSPWVPLPERESMRRLWSDEVELIIAEELASKPSVYGAWKAMRDRCLAMGLSENDFPKKISLHKRIEKERERAQQFGVNLNPLVAESVARHIH